MVEPGRIVRRPSCMRQIRLKPAGAMLAAVSLALALAACTTARPSSSVPVRVQAASAHASSSDAATARNLLQSAEVDAAAILKSFVVPPGGRPLAKPPSLIGGPDQTTRLTDGQILSVGQVSFWEAPGDPQTVLAWERAHLPSRFTENGSSGLAPVWSGEFWLAPSGALTGRSLTVEVTNAGDGQTAIRVDASVSWQPPRLASDLVPAAVRAVTIAQVYGEGVPGGSPLGPVTITDPARVHALVALVDALPLSLIPPDAPCAMPPGPYLSLTFRARPAGPALAVAVTDQNCGTVDFTINGKETPSLTQDQTLDTQILKLAALPWKPATR